MWACWARNLDQTHVDDLGDLFGGAALGLHREHDRRAEVGRDPRVHGQLAGSCDVGVVAADDQYRVALVGYVVIPVDDVGDRAVRILVQLLVADADTLVVGQTGGGVGQQQFQDVVAVLARRRVMGRKTPTLATVAASRCRMPSAIVDLPVSPSGEAM